MASREWDDADHHTSRARELLRQRRWLEALTELRAVADANPFDRECLLDIGQACEALERWTDAADAYQRAIELIPEDPAVLVRLASVQHPAGNSLGALRSLERAEAIDAAYEPLYCQRVRILSDLARHEEADEAFYLGRLFREHCPRCYHHIALSLMARGDVERAIYCWRRCLDLPADGQPARATLHQHLADALHRRGDLEAARAHYGKSLALEPDNVGSLLSLAGLLIDQHRVDDAAPRVRRALKLAGDHPGALLLLGRLQLRQGCYESALQAFEQALQIDPTYPRVHMSAASACLRLGDRGSAVAHLRREMALRPEDPTTLNEIANLLIDAGDPESASTCLRRAIKINPALPLIWQNLAVAECLQKRFDAGIDASREALRLDPQNLSVLHNLALAEMDAGRLIEAMGHVREGLSRAPSDRTLQRLRFRLRLLRWTKWLR